MAKEEDANMSKKGSRWGIRPPNIKATPQPVAAANKNPEVGVLHVLGRARSNKKGTGATADNSVAGADRAPTSIDLGKKPNAQPTASAATTSIDHLGQKAKAPPTASAAGAAKEAQPEEDTVGVGANDSSPNSSRDSKLAEIWSSLEELKEDNKSLKEDNKSLKEDNKSLKEDNESLKEDNGFFKEKVKSLEGLEKKVKSLEGLEKKVKSLEGDVDTLKLRFDEMSEVFTPAVNFAIFETAIETFPVKQNKHHKHHALMLGEYVFVFQTRGQRGTRPLQETVMELSDDQATRENTVADVLVGVASLLRICDDDFVRDFDKNKRKRNDLMHCKRFIDALFGRVEPETTGHGYEHTKQKVKEWVDAFEKLASEKGEFCGSIEKAAGHLARTSL